MKQHFLQHIQQCRWLLSVLLLGSFHGTLSPWRCEGAPSPSEPGETAPHPTGPNPSSELHQLSLRDEIIRDTGLSLTVLHEKRRTYFWFQMKKMVNSKLLLL